MAKTQNDPKQESPLDIETLQENIKGLELEKEMLKQQNEKLENEKKQLLTEREQNSEQKDQTIKSLEEKISKLEEDKKTFKLQLSEYEAQNEELSKRPLPSNNNDEELITKLNQDLATANEKAQKAESEAGKLQNQIQSLTDQLTALQSETKGYILQPFVTKYLEQLAVKLSAKYKKEVTPVNIIEDYIIRYNLTEHWTQWFHPWVMSEKDAVNIAREINPEIKSFEDIKKALNIK